MRACRRPAHRLTTAHACAIFPFVAESGLGARGTYVGQHTYGAFVFDPFELYGSVLSNPNILVWGEVGSAKSSLVKSLLWRRRCLRGPVREEYRVIDPKGEYDRLAEAFGVDPVRFVSGGHLRVNPLDPVIAPPPGSPAGTADQRLFLLEDIAEHLLGRAMVAAEFAALERAFAEAVAAAEARGQQPVIPQVITGLFQPSTETARQLSAPAKRIAEDARELALALRRIGSGDLRGMFDGPTSPGLRLSGELVTVNLRAVSGTAVPLLALCADAWLRGGWSATDAGHVRRIVVNEEAWLLLSQLGVARTWRENYKLARAYGVANIAVMHRLSDLDAAGGAGSEQVELARGLLADAETRVVYRQKHEEAERARQVLGLTDTETAVVEALPAGQALWLVGRRRFVVAHHLDPVTEAWIVDTDAAMRAS